ncbi:MAG: ATP-binding protein [Candidatus Cloacimonetes bacterium]|nr:ATP-binding protein [Candidatus Cloacimonadota bacterium]
MIERKLKERILSHFYKGKALIIYGPRQTGKTTVLRMLESEIRGRVLYLNCDEPDVRNLLEGANSSSLKKLIGRHEIVLIDEGQRVKDIGLTLKLIIDQISEVQLVVTGSSSLELSGTVNEPLTGRKFEYLLLPFSTQELVDAHGILIEQRLLEERMIYGMYPDIANGEELRTEKLLNLAGSYLYKDIFNFRDVRKPEVIEKLLQALALQMGSEVSYSELSNLLGIDYHTVTSYIDLLEKSFVVFRLPSFSRNMRNELRKSRKIYFYDNGIRNAIIKNFNPLDLRQDRGALWENFLVAERKKYFAYNGIFGDLYFWRTKNKQEIDLIEIINGKMNAYEFKWKDGKKYSLPKSFQEAYPDCGFKLINRDNYLEFLSE